MPEIKVKITKGSSEFTSTCTELQSNDFTGLLSALTKAKVETNTNLTKIVESQKDIKTRKTTKDDEDEDDSSSENDEDSAKKKQKT
jgi:hypothetical protein